MNGKGTLNEIENENKNQTASIPRGNPHSRPQRTATCLGFKSQSCQLLLAYCYGQHGQLPGTIVLATAVSINAGMENRIYLFSMSISGDSPLGKTLNQGPWRCTCGDRINIV